MGEDYANIAIQKGEDGNYITITTCKNARTGGKEAIEKIAKVEGSEFYFRTIVHAGGKCDFYYSQNGIDFTKAGETFVAKPGRWIGAKVGLFATTSAPINDTGYGDYDWFRITKNEN